MATDRKRQIKTLWKGGPLDGQIVAVPSLDRSFTIDPKAEQQSRDPMLMQRHRYVFTERAIMGFPVYEYAGVEG